MGHGGVGWDQGPRWCGGGARRSSLLSSPCGRGRSSVVGVARPICASSPAAMFRLGRWSFGLLWPRRPRGGRLARSPALSCGSARVRAAPPPAGAGAASSIILVARRQSLRSVSLWASTFLSSCSWRTVSPYGSLPVLLLLVGRSHRSGQPRAPSSLPCYLCAPGLRYIQAFSGHLPPSRT